MATAHNSAKHGDIAKTILLPGDPLRAQVIAETYLEDPFQFNTVRNMYGFTGTFKGKPVSVMGTGMGIPSIGIYSYELIHMYGVRNLIRVGSCGSITNRANIGDIIMAEGACTDSSYAVQYGLPGSFSAIASFDLLRRAADSAEAHGFSYLVGNILSSDVFYNASPAWKKWAKMGCLGIEMETYALYCNAAYATNTIGEENASPMPTGRVRALGIFTVSDSLVTGEETTAEERQNNFTNMMEVALDVAAQLQ
ncbi:MAG: purine-nucleoside phosphorylase [Lachnospiraceae bacterium]|nr:purine-nucleoside phosphorylase [Lachnospiraceae bacterium]